MSARRGPHPPHPPVVPPGTPVPRADDRLQLIAVVSSIEEACLYFWLQWTDPFGVVYVFCVKIVAWFADGSTQYV